MDEFVTVMTFTYPHEFLVIRSKLESEGIECFMKDELTVQVDPFYSNAIGGIKLQVRLSQWEQAVAILLDAGYLKEEDFRPSKIYRWIGRWLSRLKR